MRWEGDRLVYNKNGVTVEVGEVTDRFRWMLSDEARKEPVWGLFVKILGSPGSSFSIQQVIDRFYASPYFSGYGLKPIRKIGFPSK